MVPGVPGAFVTVTGPTALQRDGDLWLAPVLGPTLLIPRIGHATIPIAGVSHKTGDVAIGSGIALDGEHILTAAHVVRGMEVDTDVVRPAVGSSRDANPHPSGTLHVEQVEAHPEVDVAIVRVSGLNGAHMDAADGLAWRDPTWSDEVTIFGYPSVPTVFETHLIVQRGKVVNPRVVSAGGQAFLFSATARPGNSGGPVTGQDGRLLGIVTHQTIEPNSTNPDGEDAPAEQVPDGEQGGKPPTPSKRPEAAPFYAGVPSSVIATALADIGFGSLARLETWQR